MRRLLPIAMTAVIAPSFLLALLATAGNAQGRISAVWANDGGDKVLAEERRVSGGLSIAPAQGPKNSVWDGAAISLFGARNESLGFNLVIESADGASDVTVRLDRLDGPGGAAIASRTARGDGVFDYTGRNIELFRVAYLPVKGLSMMSYDIYEERWIPSKMRRPFDVVRYGSSWTGAPRKGFEKFSDRPGADKSFPDIAVPLETQPAFTVPAGGNQSVWVDIHIPKATPPGTYAGKMIVAEPGGPERVIPVSLAVRGFTLPDKPSAIASTWLEIYDIAERFLGTPRRYTDPRSNDYRLIVPVLERYAQMLHRHRVVTILDENEGIAPPRPETVARLKGTLYSAAKGYDGPGKDTGDGAFFIGPYGGWKWKKGSQADYNRHTDAWMAWFATHAPNTPRYLYLTDEPNLKDPKAAAEINGWLDKLWANPGIGNRLPTMITAGMEQARQQIPRVNAMAGWYGVANTEPFQSAVEEHLKAGPVNQLWQYNGKRPASGSFAIEDDGVALRVVQWAAFKKGIAGWFYWAASYYTDYQGGNGKTDVWRQAKTFGWPAKPDPVRGETSGTYANGDGVLIYPGIDRVFRDSPAPGINGPVASLRLKLWRRGIQDADYLTLALQKDPAATKAIVDRIVPKVLWEVGVYSQRDPSYQHGGLGDGISWPTDPDVWEDARRRLADIIERK